MRWREPVVPTRENQYSMQRKDGLMAILLPVAGKASGTQRHPTPCRRRDLLSQATVASWISQSDLVLPANVLRRRKMVADVFGMTGGSLMAVFPCSAGSLPSGQGSAHVILMTPAPAQLRTLVIPDFHVDKSQVPLITNGGPFHQWLTQASAPVLVMIQWDGRVTSIVQGCYVAANNVRRLSGYWRRRSAAGFLQFP
jgi:hypothetical protein